MKGKEAKTFLAYSLLAVLVVMAGIVLTNLVIAFSQGDQAVSITYRALENGNAIAGRQYTPFCLTDCHLPVCISYDGNSVPAALNLGNQDLSHSLIYAQGADQSVLKEMGIDYLTTETYSVDVADYGTCTGQVLNNETGKYDNYSYSCVTDSHQEQRTREVWKPFKDISQLQLEKRKEFCFDIWGKLAIKQNSKFAVDIIPIVKLESSQFSFDELAWWNQTGTLYRRNHTGNYSYPANATTKNMPCLINSARGFNDSNVFNYIWGKCDTNSTQLYYNNASDYYLLNGSFPGYILSDLVQLSMDTEGKSGAYDYNPTFVWDNFTLVILANEGNTSNISTDISSVNSSGQIVRRLNFTNASSSCTIGNNVSAVSGFINIVPNGYVRNAIDLPGSACSTLRVESSQRDLHAREWTAEWVFKADSYGVANGEFIYWKEGSSTGRAGFDNNGIFQLLFNGAGGGDCLMYPSLDLGVWYYAALRATNSQVSLFVGSANGTNHWFGPCNNNGSLYPTDGSLTIGGNPNGGGNFDGLFDMFALSNISRTADWIEARYQNIILNYSFLGGNQTVSNIPYAPNITTISVIPSPAFDTSPLNCTVSYNDSNGDTGTVNLSWYNSSTIHSSTLKTSVVSGQSVSFNLSSGVQAVGETWNCSANATDSSGLVSNTNSTTTIIQANITFVVRSGEDNNSLNNWNLNCSNSFSKVGANSSYSINFTLGDYSCSIVKGSYFNETVSFSADSDKTINVYLDEIGGLTNQEHDWLESQNSWMEALYNCVFGNTSCILKEINDTVTDVWKYVTKTNRAVVTQEKFISSTLGSSSNIVINYTINIPYKAGYAEGGLLPIRMYFWFTDPAKTQCYNQDKRNNETQNRAETPFCFPLIAETLGPNNGSITFNVTLRPNLTAGDYNVTRGIEIDPIIDGLRTWINYGIEDVGQIAVEEGALTPEINLAKTSEIYPSLSTTEQIASFTGNVVNSAKTFLTRSDIVTLVGMGMLTFVISLITIVVSVTIYKTRKLQYSV